MTEQITPLLNRYPELACVSNEIVDAFQLMAQCYERGGKLLIAGNGGSAADSEHMAGELMKKFRLSRPLPPELREKLCEEDPVRGAMLAQNLECSLTAVPLVAHEAISTAYINDVDGQGMFAQQLLGYGRKGDVFLAISTSGNSENIINAAILAKAMDIRVIGLTGGSGGELAQIADVSVVVPRQETYLIQELHLPIYHWWCMMLEEKFFGA